MLQPPFSCVHQQTPAAPPRCKRHTLQRYQTGRQVRRNMHSFQQREQRIQAIHIAAFRH